LVENIDSNPDELVAELKQIGLGQTREEIFEKWEWAIDAALPYDKFFLEAFCLRPSSLINRKRCVVTYRLTTPCHKYGGFEMNRLLEHFTPEKFEAIVEMAINERCPDHDIKFVIMDKLGSSTLLKHLIADPNSNESPYQTENKWRLFSRGISGYLRNGDVVVGRSRKAGQAYLYFYEESPLENGELIRSVDEIYEEEQYIIAYDLFTQAWQPVL